MHMPTANTELIGQLRNAIASWTAEVGVAQESLSRQIDGANAQLKRLLEVLRDRNEHALALAQANQELITLRQAVQQSGLPAGAVTQYTAGAGHAGNAATKELLHTFDRLETAVVSWTDQVGRSQGGLVQQFNTANGQLERLVGLLGAGPNGSGGAPDALEEELEQLQHENNVLSSEVYALNIELESLRREQEEFASANLASETERIVRQRAEIEQLEDLVRDREEALSASERAAADLTREVEALQKELSLRDVTEQRLQQAVELQRQETGQHLAALSALSGEMESLRRAFLGEEAGDSETETPEPLGPAPDEGEHIAEDGAQERIAALEATIAQLELEREEVQVLKDRIEAFQATIVELETRPEASALEAAQQQIRELTEQVDALSAGQANAEAVAAERDTLREENSRLAARIDTLSTGQTDAEAIVAECDALREENSRLTAELAVLEARPTAEALEAAQRQAAELAGAINQLSAEVGGAEAADEELDALREANALLNAQLAALESQPDTEELEAARQQLAEMASIIEELTAEKNPPDAGALDALRDENAALRAQIEELEATLPSPEIPVLEARIAELEAQRVIDRDAAVPQPAPTDAEKEGLRRALATMEADLKALRRREEDTVASARTLLEELESHRTYEAAQDTALAEVRGENARLQQALVAAREDLAAAEANATSVEAALAEARGQIALLEDERANLRLQIAALDAEQPEAAAPSVDTAAEIERLTAQLARQGADLQEYRDSQITAEKWIAGLEQQLDDAQKEYAALLSDHAELEGKYDAFAAQLDAIRSQEGSRGDALDEVRSEMLEVRHYAGELETEIARLNARLSEKTQAVEAALEAQAALEVQREADRAEADAAQSALQQALAHAQSELEAAHERERVLAGESEAYAQAAAAQSEYDTELNEALARTSAVLADQQQALSERDAQIEALRQDIAEMEAQLHELALRETDSRQQTEALGEALSGMRETDVHYQEELEKSRTLLETLRAEHGRQQLTVDDLSNRGRELERLLEAAREDEMASLATVESLQEELKAVQEKERAEEEALAEARALVVAQHDALQQWEAQVSALEERMAAMATEKDQLSRETAAQQEEIRLAMSQVNRAMHERDELLEALEAEKEKKGRVHAGAAGEGLGALEALEAREIRARQQDILVSELTQSDHNRGLGNILVDAGILTPEQLDSALQAQQQDPSQLLGTILIEQGYVTDDAIAQAVACQLEKPMVNPMEIHIQKNAIKALNKDICTWHVCVPLRITADRMVVAMANPLDESAIMKLRDMSQREITPVVGTPTQIMGAIEDCYGSF